MRGARFERANRPDAIARIIASAAQVELGVALEQLEVGCRVIAEAMSDETAEAAAAQLALLDTAGGTP